MSAELGEHIQLKKKIQNRNTTLDKVKDGYDYLGGVG